jgi:ubiquinol-cytochrome c reductase iron-sulfur subunit
MSDESIRDRLKSPAPSDEANSGGDSRHSELTSADFQQTHSTPADPGQRVAHGGTTVLHEETSGLAHHDLDPDEAAAAERKIAMLFLLSVLGVVGFFAVYWFAPFQFAVEEDNEYYTPLLGVTMALALGGMGAGAVMWAKTLMHGEETVQERHDLASSPEDRAETGQMLKDGLAQTQLGRRKLLTGSLLLAGASLPVLAVVPLAGLGKWQHKERSLGTTAWAKGVRLVRENGTPVRLGDLQVGGAESVFPDVASGAKYADSAVLLIRMRPDELKPSRNPDDWAIDGHVAYSVICTHLGCPVKLYEQQTHNLFCPCHQSTFKADEGCKVTFGPAARPLPQLALALDDEGFFVAQGDFAEPVGPSFWERRDDYLKDL